MAAPPKRQPRKHPPRSCPPRRCLGQELPVGEPVPEEPAVEDLVETSSEPAAEPDSEAAETTEQDQQPADTLADQPPADPAPTLAKPDDITLPDAELAGDTPGALAEAALETELASLPEGLAGAAIPVPQPRPANPAKPDTPAVTDVAPPADTAPARDNGLPGVRQLSSSVNTGHAIATTAMRNMPREARGSQLCTTELREQLRRAPRSYSLELLPSYGLPGGNELAVPNAAFRAERRLVRSELPLHHRRRRPQGRGFQLQGRRPDPAVAVAGKGFPGFLRGGGRAGYTVQPIGHLQNRPDRLLTVFAGSALSRVGVWGWV